MVDVITDAYQELVNRLSNPESGLNYLGEFTTGQAEEGWYLTAPAVQLLLGKIILPELDRMSGSVVRFTMNVKIFIYEDAHYGEYDKESQRGSLPAFRNFYNAIFKFPFPSVWLTAPEIDVETYGRSLDGGLANIWVLDFKVKTQAGTLGSL